MSEKEPAWSTTAKALTIAITVGLDPQKTQAYVGIFASLTPGAWRINKVAHNEELEEQETA